MTSTIEPARGQPAPAEPDTSGPMRRVLRHPVSSSFGFAVRRPVLAVVVVALVVRVVAAVALALRGGYTIPDEGQYVELARYVTDGRGADAWFPGYGQSLYDSTYAFTGLLADLFRVFGPHRILGQLIAAVFGAVTAGFATWLAGRVVSVRWALAAGLLVALLPSQVLWSSVVLRESMVWSGAAALAVAVALSARARGPRQLIGAALLGAGGLLALGFLREQTALVAVWAMLIALCTFHVARPVLVRSSALVLALGITIFAGMGPLGYGLVEKAVPSLALKRLNLGIGASSSFVSEKPVQTPAPTPTDTAGAGGGRDRNTRPPSPSPPAPTPPSNGDVVRAADGQEYAVDDSPSTVALRVFPKGLVAMTVRPFPWEPPTSTPMRFAQVEDAGWGLLFLLGVLGVWAGRKRREVLAYPVAFTVGILAMGAITQGNLGTAFRHRGQVLWALAPLAALGLHWLVQRYRRRDSTPT